MLTATFTADVDILFDGRLPFYSKETNRWSGIIL